MRPPTIHGQQSSTFNSPPLETMMTLPEMYDWHGKKSSNHPLFVFEDESENTSVITWGQAVPGIQRASKFIKSQLPSLENDESHERLIIGVLASLDTVTYFCLLVGILRMGWTVFPMSPRNSAEVVAEMLKKSKATYIIASSDAAMQNVSAESVKVLTERTVPVLVAPTFADLFPPEGDTVKVQAEEILMRTKLDLDTPGAILHSSGTTGNPKPVTWTHRALRQFALHPCYGDIDLAGKVMSIHAMGMHHGVGMLQVAFVATTGLVLSTFRPHSTPTVPNPVNVLEGAMRLKSDFIYCAPTFIETWAQNRTSVDSLALLDGILFGGGPLNNDVGDALVTKGVSIYSSYGSTQCGRLSKFCKESLGSDWEYFEFVDYMDPHFVPDGHGAFEVVIAETDDFMPCVINCELDGKNAYATNDLVVRHPTNQALWRLIGRTDDQIMHSTGLKTNPRPLEKVLEEDPQIRSAMIFGRGHFNCGLLVQPASEFIPGPENKAGIEAFLESIWPTVQKANRQAPSHSRLFKEMILVASPDKPFIYNSKGSAKRDAMLAAYEDEITNLYNSSSEILRNGPSNWNLQPTMEFVRQSIRNVMGVENMSDDDDIFDHGCDSLQATWIRNIILTTLRRTNSEIARGIPINVVYQYSSISSLTKFISERVQHGMSDEELTTQPSLNARPSSIPSKERVRKAADRYIAELLTAETERTNDDCILLTGSSGSLGVNLLAQMIKDARIKRIYALSRETKDISLMEKHRLAFRKAGLDETSLDSIKVVLLSANLALPDFGLNSDSLAEMIFMVTHIMHNGKIILSSDLPEIPNCCRTLGWRVDFNASLRSFDSCLKGIINLISFAISCKKQPRFIFVSSVGVVHDVPGSEPVLEEPVNVNDCPSGSGYSESKWIAEQIVVEATARTALKAVIVRLGQLTGSDNGNWKENEWFPSLIKSSVMLRLLPDVRGVVSWLPCSTVAKAILEIRDSFEPFLHVVHPAGVAWSEIMAEFSARLKLRVVPYSVWLSSLERSGQDGSEDGTFDEELLRASPALQLLGYFQHADVTSPGREQLGARVLSTRKALKASPTLCSPNLPRFGGSDVDKWLSSWRASGFL